MDRHRFGVDLTTNIRVFPDREYTIRSDVPLDFSIDKKLFLKRNRAFDFDTTRENAFPSFGFGLHFSTDSGCGLGYGHRGSAGRMRSCHSDSPSPLSRSMLNRLLVVSNLRSPRE